MNRLPKLTKRQAEAAVHRAGESLALTSGAGCGKTLVLARRFTSLLMAAGGADENPFDRFVALTFTDKAALEMIARVRAVLADALARSKSAAERQRLADWMTELPAAHISTIHSFCASLLRRHAVEAGVDPGFSVAADDLLSGQMRAVAAEDAVLRAVEAGDENVIELLARAGADRLVDDVRELLDKRISRQGMDLSDPAKILRRWTDGRQELRRECFRRLRGDAGVREELACLAAYPCGEPDDRLEAYRREKLGVVERILDDPEAADGKVLKALKPPGNLGGQKAWGGKDALKAYRDRLKCFVQTFAALSLWFEEPSPADADAAKCLTTLGGLSASAEELYARDKRRAGVLDFDDLILLTARLLRENRAVRRALRERLGQLLIDEGQDTDPVQLEMLWDMLAPQSGAGQAEGKAPPPGKLFIVGDVKQSIYRFRGAQAEAFEQLCRRFGRARIPLTESFRMHRAGVAFVNHLFERLMDGYEPVRSFRRELPPGPSVEILLAEVEPEASAQAATIAQAELVAQRVAEMIDREKLVFDGERGDWRPVRPGDVAVLFARMTSSLAYEYALQRRGLPFHVLAGTGFFRQQEVYDVLNALRAIDNPFDDVALVGVLRSAIFGLDDNVLLHLAGAAGPPYFDRLTDPAVLARLDAGKRRQMLFAAELLARLRRIKDAVGPAGLIERLLTETGYEATLLSQFHGRQKLGNVQRLLDAARSAQGGDGISLSDFVRRFNELVIEQSRYEQAPVAGEDEDAIRVMTIHKAKGLEFPVVIVPDLNARFLGARGHFLFRRDLGLTYKPPTPEEEDDGDQGSEDGGPVAYRLAKEAETVEARAEAVRKLYVAATRHQDHLIFIGADWRDKAGKLRETGCYLRQLDDVLGIAAAIDGRGSEVSYGGGFTARVARIAPGEPRRRPGTRPIGRRVISRAADAAAVAQALSSAGRETVLPLVGPLPAEGPNAVGGRIAPTALADFEHCPMLFRWRHELRVPQPAAEGGRGGPSGRLDAATAGTFFHRCMELLDFEALAAGACAAADLARVLAERAAGEMELSVEPSELASELAGMLERLRGRPLADQIASAQRRLKELAFVFRAGPFEISGQIDLLFQDAGGTWRVVDYKSDRVEADEVAARAARYELQMMLYLAAARRQVGDAAVEAVLYFLRPGASRTFAVGDALAALEGRLTELAGRLARCRRAGSFPGRADEICQSCPYATLCQRG